jgi:hypothetical protein
MTTDLIPMTANTSYPLPRAVPPDVGMSRSGHFRSWMLWLAAALFTGCGYSLLDYALNGLDDSLTQALVWAIMALMSLIAASAISAYRFLFSCAFWVAVEFFFYIVLKALAVSDEIDPVPMQKALLASLLFLAGYLLGQIIFPTPSILRVQAAPTAPGTSRLYWWLLLSFIFFKLLNYVLLLAVGGGTTALEISQATQNQGASYLFKIPNLAQACYFLLLLLAYKHGAYRKTAFAMTLWILAEGVVGAARYSIITTILINLLLCHLYVREVRLRYLLLLTPILVFVVAFFGTVRDIEVGSAEVYVNALETFIKERELIFKLFMARMDMLPQMARAFEFAELGELKIEAGMSYIYAFLHAVPRNIWPGKPLLTAAYVTELVLPGVFADGVNIFPSIMVEGYINFLWAGPLIIGAVVAGLSQIYERALLRGSLQKQAFALMVFTFPMGLINEGVHSNIFATVLYLIVIYWIWLRLTRLVVGKFVSTRLAHP